MLMPKLCWLRNSTFSWRFFYSLDWESVNEIPSFPIFLWLPFSPNAILPQDQNSLLFGRKTGCRIKTELPTEPCPWWILTQRPKEDMDSSETSRYNLPPPSSLTCSVEATWLNKTKTPMKQNSQKKQHLLPASYVSAAAWLSPRESQAPYAPILAGCCSASPLHIHRITSCAKQAVYVERMPS